MAAVKNVDVVERHSPQTTQAKCFRMRLPAATNSRGALNWGTTAASRRLIRWFGVSCGVNVGRGPATVICSGRRVLDEPTRRKRNFHLVEEIVWMRFLRGYRSPDWCGDTPLIAREIARALVSNGATSICDGVVPCRTTREIAAATSARSS